MKVILVFTAILFFLVPGYCEQSKPAHSHANLEAGAKETWDFGKVKHGEVVRHGFTLRNEGAKTINIKSVSTSCGCTASEVSKKALAPGDSTTIDVKFNSKGYSGPIKQFVFVNTDDLDNPLITFIIKAEVQK